MSEPLESRQARELRVGDVLIEPSQGRTRRTLTSVSVTGGVEFPMASLSAGGWSVIVPADWQFDVIPAAAVRNARVVEKLRIELLRGTGLGYGSAQRLAERLVESLTATGELR